MSPMDLFQSKVELLDPLKASELLGRSLGMFKETTHVSEVEGLGERLAHEIERAKKLCQKENDTSRQVGPMPTFGNMRESFLKYYSDR